MRHATGRGPKVALAASFEENDFLQPIGVTRDNGIVFGERRLRACRDVLGWDTIPARVVDVTSILAGEVAANSTRKDGVHQTKALFLQGFVRRRRHGARSNWTPRLDQPAFAQSPLPKR